ncbi:hypothetical protein ACIP5N_27685 [Streptomyces sp. NPDC088768]
MLPARCGRALYRLTHTEDGSGEREKQLGWHVGDVVGDDGERGD